MVVSRQAVAVWSARGLNQRASLEFVVTGVYYSMGCAAGDPVAFLQLLCFVLCMWRMCALDRVLFLVVLL